MKITFFVRNIKKFNKKTEIFYQRRYIRAWISFVYCALRFGASFDDFYRYEFYKKSNYERNKFVTYGRSKKLIKKYNSRQYISDFQNKEKFNIRFCKYINRDFLLCKDVSQEKFEEFVLKHKCVLMKPLRGGKG